MFSAYFQRCAHGSERTFVILSVVLVAVAVALVAATVALAIKVLAAFGTKMVDCFGSIVAKSAADGTLAVEDTQRICFESFTAGVAKLFFVRREILNKCLVIIRTAGGTADGVYIKLCRNTQSFEKGVCNRNYGCIGRCL